MKLFYVLGTVAAASIAHAGVNLNKKNNIVAYWGKNVRGLKRSQPRLREFCDDDTIDIIPLSFIDNVSPNSPPQLDFAAGVCSSIRSYSGGNRGKGGNRGNGSNRGNGGNRGKGGNHGNGGNRGKGGNHGNGGNRLTSNCANVGEDIKYCQSKGKMILLSIGGPEWGYNIDNEQDGVMVADKVWDMYMGGDGSLTNMRPFGKDVVVDGVDLNIQHWGNDGYLNFTSRMREHYEEFYNTRDCKPLYISASPICFFPDGAMSYIIENADIDMLFIRFWNTFCGAKNFQTGIDLPSQTEFNWNTWDAYVRGGDTGTYYNDHAKNKDIRLFIGVPGGPVTHRGDFASPHRMREIISEAKDYDSFAGVMLWDASTARSHITEDRQTMLQAMRRVLNEETDLAVQAYLLDQCTNTNLLQQQIEAFDIAANKCAPKSSVPPGPTPTTVPPPPPSSSSEVPPPPLPTTTEEPSPPPPTTTEKPPPPPTPTSSEEPPIPAPTSSEEPPIPPPTSVLPSPPPTSSSSEEPPSPTTVPTPPPPTTSVEPPPPPSATTEVPPPPSPTSEEPPPSTTS